MRAVSLIYYKFTAKTDKSKTSEDVERNNSILFDFQDLQQKERSLSDWIGRRLLTEIIEFQYYGDKTKINLIDEESSNRNNKESDFEDIKYNDIKLPYC